MDISSTNVGAAHVSTLMKQGATGMLSDEEIQQLMLDGKIYTRVKVWGHCPTCGKDKKSFTAASPTDERLYMKEGEVFRDMECGPCKSMKDLHEYLEKFLDSDV